MSVLHPPAPPYPFHRGRGGSRLRRQPRPPTSAPALVAGTVFTSPDIGYRVEFSPHLWSVVRQTGTDLELQVNSNRVTVIVTLEGEASADHSTAALQALVDRRIGELGADTVVLSRDTDPKDAVLGPSVGYLRGVGQSLAGVTDTPQGPSSAVVAVVMAAGDGTANIVVSVVADKAVRKQAFEVADTLMNTFRFPSEISPS
jgi:hypothetical protein